MCDCSRFINVPIFFSILEREVSAARSEMNEYRCRMDELCRVNEQQKEQFRSAVADLKGQLQDALITKENVVQMRYCVTLCI